MELMDDVIFLVLFKAQMEHSRVGMGVIENNLKHYFSIRIYSALFF